VRIATDLMLLVEDEDFHVLFNSLLGMASVNHLHLHTLFWPYESDLINRRVEPLNSNNSDGTVPLITSGTRKTTSSVYVIRRPEWFIPLLVFQLHTPAEFDSFVSNVAHCAEYLTDENQSHNLFMTRAPRLKVVGEGGGGEDGLYVTAYLIPRQNQTGAKPATNFNPASMELAGLLTAYSYQFFTSVTEQSALRIIDEDAVLPDELFDSLVDGLTDRLEGRVSWLDHLEEENSLLLTPYSRTSAVDRRWSYGLSGLSLGSGPGKRRAVSGSSAKSLPGMEAGVESLAANELEELDDCFYPVTQPQSVGGGGGSSVELRRNSSLDK